MASSAYENVRAAIADGGSDARVEVNQRALIDKILARYASAGAVYRELLQNSNDAEATTAEIIITTSSSANRDDVATTAAAAAAANVSSNKEVVTQVIYRNNGLPFRPQDWARLRKIAEGNPDETKVGAFGVGAYTMFSICEEPLVVSGRKGEEQAMSFFWKGDGLWTKTGKAPEGIVNMSASLNGKRDDGDRNWTSFILPSRDPYPLPDLVEFGQFLTASLTFTQCLKTVRVYVDQTLTLNIEKSILESHTIETPKASSWWKNDGAVTSSSSGMFTFGRGSDLTQTSVHMSVSLRRNGGMETSVVRARYASATVKTCIPANIEKRMVRVTKKRPPRELTVQIFLDAASDDDDPDESGKSNLSSKIKRLALNKQQSNGASLITDSFAPSPGSGRVFIGFRTSQTTGLGIHLAAPLLPTVEREAIDFVDSALREYNSELLEISGMLMRLAPEHEMGRIGVLWEEGRAARERRWEEARREEEKKKGQPKQEGENDDENSQKEDASTSGDIKSGFFSFATFMARNVKNTVAEAIKAVPEIVGVDDETTELLNPVDDRPLCMEERDAVLLMKAYCPRLSTPDSLVGQCLAKGFGRCLPSSSPPVLTAGGVVRGKDAVLPNHGMEAFGFANNVVRRIVLENAREYHSLIATVPTLTIDDLIKALRDQILEEKMLIRLLKWWPKLCRVERSVEKRGLLLKEAVRFDATTAEGHPAVSKSDKTASASSATTEDDVQSVQIRRLESILYYTPNKLMDLPLPESSFTPSLQNEIGLRILENSVYDQWFSPLPFEIWASFVSCDKCLTEGRPEDVNIKVMVALSKHYDSLEGWAKRRFVELLPTDSPCILFDSDGLGDGTTTVSKHRSAPPKELYMPTSDLSAFAGVGVFHKVSKRLSKAGVSDAFLLALGVRTTISIDFLFLHLDTLSWNTNPKPLIQYLLDADLSPGDMLKLRSTQYLPAEGDEAHVYAPSELYLKDDKLKIFPFVRFLQWPTSEGMSKSHRDFLMKLGVRVDVPLASVMGFMEGECKKKEGDWDQKVYSSALDYLTQRLGPQGLYEKEFSRYKGMKFLPCIRQNLETGDVIKEMQSPAACYYNPSSIVMGFSTLDPQLDTVHVATRTKCNKDPSCQVLIKRLIQFVDIAKAKVDHFEKTGGSDEERKKLAAKILTLFEAVFSYLASRTSDFDKRDVTALAKKAFIPSESRGQIVFYLPSQIFFKKESPSSAHKTPKENHDSLTETLFQQIQYNAFLSFVGVKAEPSLQEIFDLMIEKPDEVLDSLGEEKYKMLLRRIASDPPFKHVTKQIRSCPFLLGYLVIDEEVASGDEGGQKAQYILARAEDIFLVDNSFLRRQFPMLVSPMEQTIEDFYNKLGSQYISEVVKKDFEVQGPTWTDTPLTQSFASRIRERRPLLLSPTNSSRPLLPNAAKVLDDDHLEIIQADKIQAKYSFERSSKHLKVTCCSKQKTRQKTTIYLTTNPDWFDIGSAIGALILQRCQLEDALLLSQLLESPLETLRYRGFPVDRVLRPVSKPPPPPPPEPAETKSATQQEASASGSDVGGELSERNGQHVKDSKVSNPGNKEEEGFASILKQMFPTCASDIPGLLGPNPTKEKARQVANLLATKIPPLGDEKKTQDMPKNESNIDSNAMSSQRSKDDHINGLDDNKDTTKDGKSRKKKPSGLMGKMLKGFHHGVGSGGSKGMGTGTSRIKQNISQPAGDSNKPSSPENDAFTHESLEAMLNQAVQASRSVDNAGIRSPETLIQSLPQGLDRGEDGCEVIPSQNLQPFKGPHGNHKSRNGIKVFSGSSTSAPFLARNFNAVERFSIVIQHLATVYKLHLRTVAIYYEPNGNTIAFNSNKALYFNLRFFCSLHQNHVGSTCYSYWYMTFAHELAHNLVTAHNKEHGSFTESIAALYLPDFVKLLSQIP